MCIHLYTYIYMQALDGVRILCSSLATCSSAHQRLVEHVTPLLVLQSSIHVTTATVALSAGGVEGGAGGLEWQEESMRRSVDALLVCVHSRSILGLALAGSAEMCAVARFGDKVRAQGGGALLQVRRCNALHALQHTATYCTRCKHTATHCNALQRTAMHCNALQRTART